MAEISVPSAFILYGIKNCDTIKKARRWLEEKGVDFQFHDYRTAGLTSAMLQQFMQRQSWEALLNTRGTTWRKLSEEQRQAVIDANSASQLMLQQPALIKRPLLIAADGRSLLGFSTDLYQQFIAEEK